MDDLDTITFNVTCSMKKRWIPHFLAMLNYMESLGSWGSSRTVSFYADGDGDFRPKFDWLKDKEIQEFTKDNLPKPVEDQHGDRIYDAG